MGLGKTIQTIVFIKSLVCEVGEETVYAQTLIRLIFEGTARFNLPQQDVNVTGVTSQQGLVLADAHEHQPGIRAFEALEQGCATGGLRATTRPAKPFSVALANTLIFPHHE